MRTIRAREDYQMKKGYVFLIATVVLVSVIGCATPPAPTEPIVRQISNEVGFGFIRSDNPEHAGVDEGRIAATGTLGEDTALRTIMGFDLTGFEPMTVPGAYLRLYSDRSDYQEESPGVQTVELYRLTSPAVPDETSWLNQSEGTPWVNEGGDFEETPLVTVEVDFDTHDAGDFIDFESEALTAAIQDAVDNNEVLFLILVAPGLEFDAWDYRALYWVEGPDWEGFPGELVILAGES